MKANPFSSARIETPQLLLRPFVRKDFPAFAAIATQREVLEFLPSTDRMTLEELEEVFAWLIECYNTNTNNRIRKFTLALTLKESGDVVGWCGLGPLEYDESQIELYFVIGRDHWGKGIATESSRALLEYAFGVLGLVRVVAVADPRNRAAIRVLQKIGMREEGVVRGLPTAHRDYGGHMRYSIRADDWSGIATAPGPG